MKHTIPLREDHHFTRPIPKVTLQLQLSKIDNIANVQKQLSLIWAFSMKQILEKHVVCRSIATICLIQGTSWLMLASSTRLYHTVQRFYKPIYYTNLFTETWWAVIFRKTADSSKLYLATGYPLLPTKKKVPETPKGDVLAYFHVDKSRIYSRDSPVALALISRSLIRSHNTELDCSLSLSTIGELTSGLTAGLDCSHSLSAIGESTPGLSTELDCSVSLSVIGESTPGLGSGPPDRFKGWTSAVVGWDSKRGRFKKSLTAGFRRTEKDDFFNQLRNIDHKIDRDHEPKIKSGKWHTSTVNKWEKVWCDPVKENCLPKKWKINGSANAWVVVL